MSTHQTSRTTPHSLTNQNHNHNFTYPLIPSTALMALSLNTSTAPQNNFNNFPHRNSRTVLLVPKCESSSSKDGGEVDGSPRLVVGSAVIVVEAPKTIKTAASVPCLRVNSGLVKAGDVGRIVARKPKDVWAVRLAIGTYLIDGKHFNALVLDE